jgi:hypothetical protein
LGRGYSNWRFALILWILGAAWYSPALFAKPWMAALGIVPTGPKKGLAAGMIASLIGDVLVAFALLHLNPANVRHKNDRHNSVQ